MKKISARCLAILSALTVLLAPSCIQEIFEPPVVPASSDGKVVIDGALSIPAVEDGGRPTKAFGEPNDVLVKRLYVAVFDDSDILYEVASALPGSESAPTGLEGGFVCGEADSDYLTPFFVELTEVKQDVRYLHFIAVSEPLDVLERAVRGAFDAVDEAAFIRTLVTSGGDIAYWGRKEVTSITHYTRFSNITMIRNFAKAKVAVKDGITNFKVLGFKVFDAPDRGAIAPFNNNTADYLTSQSGLVQINFNRFANYSLAASYKNEDDYSPYTWLTQNNGYHGYMPVGYQYESLSGYYNSGGDTMDQNQIWVGPDDADYLYECSYRPDRNPFIIIKARYQANGTVTDSSPVYYYKVDFVYENEDAHVTEYYDILRNFQYTFNVTSVTGKGNDTVYDAVHSIALNNMQGSTLARSLTNISTDDSQIYVSTTQEIITSGSTFTLYIKSWKMENGGMTDDTNDIEASILSTSGGGSIVSSASAISIASNAETSGTYTGWHKVTFPVPDVMTLKPGEVWKQTISFKNPSGLVRMLDLVMLRPLTLRVDVTDFVPETANSQLDVKMSIPAGIEEFNFPLYFYIEQERNTLYPVALEEGSTKALSVESGQTKIPGNGSGSTYYYRRMITWKEYNEAATDVHGIKTFSSLFKTLVETSATTVWVIPADENNNFKLYDDVENVYTNQDSFVNNKMTPTVSFPYYGLQLPVSTSATVTATTNSNGTITYSSSDTSVATVDASSGMVTAKATGTTTITATVAATDSYNSASASYTLYVVAADAACGLDMHWKYEPVYVVKTGDGNAIHAPIAMVSVANGYTVTVDYTTSSTDGGAVTVDETDAETNGYVTITGTFAGTVTVKATATVKDGSSNTVMTRTMSYELQVFAGDHPEPGTIYHDETFLGPTLGDYTILSELVTTGQTYTEGSDKTTEFNTYTTYNVGTGYDPRHVWYPYYNKSTKIGFGAAASAYGAIEEPTSYWNSEQAKWETDYHNKNYASHTRLASKEIDLSASAGATLIFEHAGNYFYNNVTREDIANAETIMKGDAKVFISKNGGSTWEEATVKHYPSGDSWVFERTSVDIPNDYLVSNFRLLFDYTSIGGTEVQKTKKVKTGNETIDYPLYHPVETYVENEVEKTRTLTLELTAAELYRWNAEKQASPLVAAWAEEHEGDEEESVLKAKLKEFADEIEAGYTDEQKAAMVAAAKAVMTPNPASPGRAGTWEIRNVQIKERRFYD